jgi:hypothetical protein
MTRNLEDCVDRLVEGSAEREYHGALARVLADVEFPRTADAGLALLELLQTAEFRVGEVDSLGHPAAGSLYENADFVACAFGDVSGDAAWWATTYQHLSLEARTRISAWVDFWADAFEKSTHVRRFAR